MKQQKAHACGTWAVVPGFPEYAVTIDGRVMSTQGRAPRIMKQQANKSGHRFVFMYDKNGMHKVYIHRAVLAAWTGGDRPGLECRHLNDIPYDNRLANLAWGTRKENMQDCVRNGHTQRGEARHSNKLTETQAMAIRSMAGTMSYRELSEMFGVNKETCRRIAAGIKWGYLAARAEAKEGSL